MARKPKHPELQQKFERALRELLAGGESRKAREIFESIESRAQQFGITPSEVQDLSRNFANYAARAKDGGVIISGGPWGGYRLATSSALPIASAQTPPVPTSGSGENTPILPEQDARRVRQHWESFLHLPLTVALSAYFSSRVVSLANATDNVRWGNPDMLMLRASPLSRVQEFDASLDPAVFSLVDIAPECILASIEVKGGLDRDRAKLFTAVAEAAANSRWANEAWLAFVDWESAEQALDEDVISLARSVEVGLLEVRLSEQPHTLRTILHHAAPTRATLRIGELSRERAGVLREAESLLKLWRGEEPTFLDVDNAEQKARLLLQQALQNLRCQKGFTASASLVDLLKPLCTNDDECGYVDTMLGAVLRSAAIGAGLDIEGDLVPLLANAADNALIKKTAEAFGADLRAFSQGGLKSPSSAPSTQAPAIPRTVDPVPA